MKVIYKAEAKVYGAKHKLSINDIPFSMDMRGYPLNAEIPLNQFLTNGISEVGVELMPINTEEVLQDGAEVEITIKKYKLPFNIENFEEVFTHTRKPGSLTGEPNYGFNQSINIEIPYKNPICFDNKLINMSDRNISSKLFDQFEYIWTLFKNQDIATILKLYESKFVDYEKCYYLEGGNRKKVTEARLKKTFDDAGYQIAPYDLSAIKPYLFANGKLITLLDAEGYNYIMYYHFEERILTEFPVFLGIDDADEITVSH